MINPTLLMLTALAAMLVVAILTDLRAHRIPNAVTLCGSSVALLLQIIAAGSAGLQSGLLGAGAGLLCFAPLYLLRGMGAGDVKLLAAIGAFTGPHGAFVAAVVSLCTGGLAAAGFVAWRAIGAGLLCISRDGLAMAPAAGLLAARAARRVRFAFALPIAAGGFAAAGFSGLFQGLS